MLPCCRFACVVVVCLSVCLLPGAVLGQERADEKAPALEIKPKQVLKLDAKYGTSSFSRDGGRYAIVDGGTVRVWETRNWTQLAHYTERPEVEFYVILSPDGRLLVFTSNDRKDINLLDITSGKILRTLRGHSKSILCLTFSPDGKTIAATDYNDDLKLWDVETGKDLDRFKTKPKGPGKGAHLAFSPDGSTLAVAPEDGSVHLLNVSKGEEIRRFVATDTKSNLIKGLAYSPDGKFLAVGQGRENLVTVWDVSAGKPLWQLKWAVSQDPRYVRGTERIPLPDPNRPPGVNSLAFSADNRTLVVACSDTCLRGWEMATGELRFQVEQPLMYQTLPFSGRTFAATRIGVTKSDILICDSQACLSPRRLTAPPNVEELWTGLDIRDATRAYERMRDLASVPKEGLPILDKRLRTVEPVKATVLDSLVHDLDDEDFQVRDRASRRFEELGEVAKPVLTKALEGKPSAEARTRIKELLETLDSPPSGDRLRVLRAVEVLELIGSPEARDVLKRLAGGAPEAPLTRQAKAGLERLDAN
jgi:WD40 repeat protein